jgi:GNAT superfamily N-acetyltransferase
MKKRPPARRVRLSAGRRPRPSAALSTTAGGLLVRAARPSERRVVLDLVERLLAELGEEGQETGLLPKRALAASWARRGPAVSAFLAFDDGGRAIGVTTLSESWAAYAGGAYGIVNEMYVAPEHRSRRVGARLIAAVREHGRRRGWRRIDVTAPESPRWDRSRRFYETLGFVFTGPKLKLLLV